MMPPEQLEALALAMKGYRSPPRQIQPVMAEEFFGISVDVLEVLIEQGLLEKKRISFSGGETLDAFIVTPEGAKQYDILTDSED